MLMVAVQSSNVARVGHEGTTLRVEFKDGAVYEWQDISHELYIALLTAPSKGAFVARHLGKGTPVHQSNAARSHELVKVTQQNTLNTFEPDECCTKRLRKVMLTGVLDIAESWTCPNCGETWKPEQVGPIRHWSPVPLIAVF